MRPILIIDDDPEQRSLLRRTLLTAGYPVLCAADGREALAVLEDAEVPSLIVTDLRMPLMPGREVVDWLRKTPRFAQVPICVVTSGDLEEAPAAATYTLRKPIKIDQLMRIVQSHCKRD